VVIAFCVYRFNLNNSPPSNKAGRTQETRQDLDKKSRTTADPTLPTPETPKTMESPNVYTPPTSADNIEISAQRSNTDSIVIQTKLHGYSDGECALSVSNGSRNTRQTAPVMFQREFSTCAGFTVPIDSVGTGKWNITLTVSAGDSEQSKSIVYEVRQ